MFPKGDRQTLEQLDICYFIDIKVFYVIINIAEKGNQ